MPPPGSFVGRVPELAALEESLAAAILGRGSAIVLAGEPGIGKTRLATELVERAERRGARVLWAACATDAAAPPFWPFVQLLQPLYAEHPAGELAQRFGAGVGDVLALLGPSRDRAALPASDQQRFRLFETVTEMLVAAASEKPAVLVFDDLHAADPGCLQLVLFLVRALRRSRLLLVATMRSAEAQRPEVAPLLVGRLAREATMLPVEGWTSEEVAAFLRQRRSVAGATNADAIHRASGGNPFFVGEIARLFASAPGDARIAVPVHVRHAVLARRDSLPPRLHGVLDAAAVAGLSFRTATVVAMTGLPADDVRGMLSEAEDAGLLQRGAGDTWSFRHEIARDVIYEAQPAGPRRRAHLAAAEVCSTERGGNESIAHHLLAALPDAPLEDALRHTLAAGEAASAALAHERAAIWLRRGLEAMAVHRDVPSDTATGRAPGVRDLHGRLLVALGDACWAAGDHVSSRAAYEDAAALAESAGDGVLLARAALGLGGRQQRAHVQYDARVVALLERALGALGNEETSMRARLQARLAYALYAAPGSRPQREAHCRAAIDAARSAADVQALRWVLGDVRWALWGPATLSVRRAIGDEMIRLAGRCGDREAALVEQGWRLVDALELGDRCTLDEAFAAYRGGAAELRLPWYAWYATRFACLLAQVEGRLDDAERLAGEALSAGQQAGHPDASLSFASQLLGIRLAQHRAAEIEAAAEAGVAQYPDVSLWRRLLARSRVAQGREAEAAGEIERARHGAIVDAPGDFLHLPSLAMLAEVACAAGDDDVRRRVHEALAPWSGRQVVLGFGMAFLGPVDVYLGELAAAFGDVEDARRHLEAAEAQASALAATKWALRAHAGLRSLAGAARREAGDARRPIDADRHLEPGDRRSEGGGQQLEPRRADAAAPSPMAGGGSTKGAAALRAAQHAVFEADGAGWRGEFAGTSFRIGPLRGMVYLRALLEVPERELHVLELAALPDPGPRARHANGAVADRADVGQSGPMLDERAKRAYRTRLAELEAELDEAGNFADSGRIALVRAEIDALEREMARAVGLGGRDRPAGGAAERARVAVAKRIRGALERLGEQSPELQRYLEATVRTGVYCVYRPDPGRPVDWRL